MSIALPAALTIGEIARQAGCPAHRVRWVLESRDVKPVARAGCANIYSETDTRYVLAELRRIAADRGGL